MGRILRSSNVGAALRAKQRGFLLNPYRFGVAGGGGGGTDPDFANVQYLLHGDDAGTTTYTDSSSFARTATALGTGVVTSATKSQWGGRSLRFPGTGALQFGTTSTFAFMHQPGAKWTWEAWVAFDNFTVDRIFWSTSNGSTGNIGTFCGLSSTRGLDFGVYNGSGSAGSSPLALAAYLGPGTFPNDANFHFVSIRWDHTLTTGNLSWSVDGASGGTANKTGNTPSSSSTSTAAMKVGAWSSNFTALGYMDDVRMTNSVWRTQVSPTAAFPDA